MKSMKMMTIAIALIVGLAGCEKPAPDGANAFLGPWHCTAKITYKFTSPPNTPDKTSTLELTRTFTGTGNALESTSVTASGTSSGCVTKWAVEGTTATMQPDQTCSAKVTMPDGALREVTTRHEQGRANLSGGTIREIGSADVDVVEGAVHLVGTGTADTTCTRKQ